MSHLIRVAEQRPKVAPHTVHDEHHVERANKSRKKNRYDDPMNESPRHVHNLTSGQLARHVPARVNLSPVSDYLRILLRHRPEARFIPRALVYLFKLVAMEPFRLAEQLIDRICPTHRVLPQDPIFILGYYRSGTTHLQELMLQDPRFGYMNFYQCFFPTAFTSTERLLKPIFERIVRAKGFLHPAHQIPFSFVLPGEEDVSLAASGFELAANWGQVFPQSFQDIYTRSGLMDGISPTDFGRFKRVLYDLIWRVSIANKHRRLVLKSPPHTSRVSMLLELYPNAKFLFIRRDPYEVFASNKGLWKSFAVTWLQRVTATEVQNNILWSHDRTHHAYERDKHLLQSGQLCEVTFEDFMTAPMKVAEHAYATLNLGGFDDAAPYFEAFLKRAHKGQPPPYALTSSEIEAIDSHLGAWLTRWNYPSRRARSAA